MADYVVLPLPDPPKTQALTSKTFLPGPLDGSLTVPELLDWNFEHSPYHPVVVYPDDDGCNHTIHWTEVFCAIIRMGHYIRSLVSLEEEDSRAHTTFAILAQSGMTNFLSLHL